MLVALEYVLGGWPISRVLLEAGLRSLVLGMSELASRGLVMPIGTHAAYDFATSPVGQNLGPGRWRSIIAAGDKSRVQRLITVSYLVVMSLALTGLCVFDRRVKRRGPDAVAAT